MSTCSVENIPKRKDTLEPGSFVVHMATGILEHRCIVLVLIQLNALPEIHGIQCIYLFQTKIITGPDQLIHNCNYLTRSFRDVIYEWRMFVARGTARSENSSPKKKPNKINGVPTECFSYR